MENERRSGKRVLNQEKRQKAGYYSEPLWHIIASEEVKSKIYLSLIGREVNAKKLENELEIKKSRKHFEGYSGPYVRVTVVGMEKEGLLQREVGESDTRGRSRNLVYFYEADVGIYLNYLDRNTDVTKPDRETVEEIITEPASSTLNRAAKADTSGANAILDISILAAAPDYFFRESL